MSSQFTIADVNKAIEDVKKDKIPLYWIIKQTNISNTYMIRGSESQVRFLAMRWDHEENITQDEKRHQIQQMNEKNTDPKIWKNIQSHIDIDLHVKWKELIHDTLSILKVKDAQIAVDEFTSIKTFLNHQQIDEIEKAAKLGGEMSFWHIFIPGNESQNILYCNEIQARFMASIWDVDEGRESQRYQVYRARKENIRKDIWEEMQYKSSDENTWELWNNLISDLRIKADAVESANKMIDSFSP